MARIYPEAAQLLAFKRLANTHPLDITRIIGVIAELKGHYCNEWDQLYITQVDQEFEACTCDIKSPEDRVVELEHALRLIRDATHVALESGGHVQSISGLAQIKYIADNANNRKPTKKEKG